MYDLLKDRQNNAIRNAERLLSQYSEANPEGNKPSTTVYLLVKELNKWI